MRHTLLGLNQALSVISMSALLAVNSNIHGSTVEMALLKVCPEWMLHEVLSDVYVLTDSGDIALAWHMVLPH